MSKRNTEYVSVLTSCPQLTMENHEMRPKGD